jgi:hypothetical protein
MLPLAAFALRFLTASDMVSANPHTVSMKNNTLLSIMSLLSVLVMSLHITDDIVRGLSKPAADNVGAVVIFVVWLVGILLLSERRSGHVIMLLGGIFAAGMPILHMRGASYVAIAKSGGGFFFVWSLIVVGVTGTFAVILSLRALWMLRRARHLDPATSTQP